jgi:hypothetical protein
MKDQQIQSDFTIPKNGYAAFDALSLRQLIIDRLSENSNFTDQNYIGSNLASIIDIISYSYHTLIYYLNKTSTETLFSEAELYENINRIVKLINYKPVGDQTATLSFEASAKSFLPIGSYTIPRYSYVFTNRTRYSFVEDVNFYKPQEGVVYLEDLSRRKLLFEGTWIEHPAFVATGENFETFVINTKDIVDYNNLDVYIKPKAQNSYIKYERTANIFYETNTSMVFEPRVNEYKQIELKFGNSIYGNKLNEGDIVQVYYLASTGKLGEVGPYALRQTSLNIFNTPLFNQVYNDTQKQQLNSLNSNLANNFILSNPQGSTPFSSAEDVEEIRTNAPKSFRSANRLVSLTDYESFIRERYSYLLTDVKVINNWTYLTTYLKYYKDIGLQDLDKTDRPLFNQIYFADSCNFNNIYILLAPRLQNGTVNFVQPSLKQLIIDALQERKTSTSEIVFVDPVYKAITFGVTNTFGDIDLENEQSCKLVIKRDLNVAIDDSYIKNRVIEVIKSFFTSSRMFGELLDLRQLYSDIVSIDGVSDVYTQRVTEDEQTIITSGLSFFVWNPTYPERDKQVVSTNYKVKDFEFVYFYNIDYIVNKVELETKNITYQVLEY